MKVDVDSPIDFKYTDADGKEYAKANDGKFYEADKVNADGSLKKDGERPTALDPDAVAKLKKGAQLTNGTNSDGVANNPYETKDPVNVAVAKLLKDKPNATKEEIMEAMAGAIAAKPEAKDDIVKGEGGVTLDNVGWAERGDQAVNKDQLDQTVNKSGFFIKGNGKDPFKGDENGNKLGEETVKEKVTPNDAVNFVDGSNTKVEIATHLDPKTGADTTTVKYSVVDDPTFNTVQVGGANGPKISASADGKSLKVGDKDGKPVKITNVAEGVDDNDAVNVKQLKDALNGNVTNLGDVYNHIDKTDKRLRAGIAGSNAAASLPQVYIPGKSMVAAAVGTYEGQSAISVGYSRASDNGKVIFKLQGNANSRGKVGAGVGVGYQW